MTKICKKCGAEFEPHTNHQLKCSTCIRKEGRAGKRTAPPKPCKTCGEVFTPTGANHKYCSPKCKDIRQYHIKRNYDLTLVQYNHLKETLGTDCMICGSKTVENSRGRNNLCIDHDHDTGKVRGFLCHHCNCAIGMFKDDVKRMKLAIEYLEKSEERAEAIETLKSEVE